MRWWCRHSKSPFPWGRSPPSSGSSLPSARSIRQLSRGPPTIRVLAKVWWDGSSGTARKTMPQHGHDDTLQLLNFAEFTFWEVERMKGHPNSGWHLGAVVVVCSGRRRRVLQYGGHDNVPESPRGHLVAHPLQGEQLGAGDLLRQRNRVAVGVHGILGAVYDERRNAHLPEALSPTITRVDAGMVGNARGEVGRAIEGAGCDPACGRLVEGARACERTLAFDYVVDHGVPI